MKKNKWVRICLTAVLFTVTVSLTACGDRNNSATVELKNSASTQKDAAKDTAEGSGSDNHSVENENAQAIDAEQALSIAVGHAGLTEQDISSNKVREDTEDGQKVFEVEFFSVEGAEYEYELSSRGGTILSFSYDAEKVFPKTTSSGGETVTEEEAKKAVLERLPEAASEEIKMVLTEDDGWMEYEAYLFYDGMQHEFQIDAGSGKLIEWEGELPGH